MINEHDEIVHAISSELTSQKHIVGIILIGSVANSTHHKKSDIDLYVIGHGEKDRVTTYYRDNLFVQIQWRDVEDFKQKVYKRTRNKPIAIAGKIIFDPTLTIAAYMEEGKKIAEQGPLPLTATEINAIRLHITEELESINSCIENNNLIRAILAINDLLFDIINVYYNHNNWWWPAKKHLIPDVLIKDPDIGKKAEEIILSSDVNRKYALLTEISLNVLPLIGGELRELEIFY